jgi:hypothetical protein
MKSYVTIGITAITLTSTALALAAVAAAAPTGPSQVNDTVRTLEASGYHVIVNRTGVAPLSHLRSSALRGLHIRNRNSSNFGGRQRDRHTGG